MNKSLLVFSVMLAEVNKAINRKQKLRISKKIVPRLKAWHPIPRSANSKLLWHSIVHLRDRLEIRRKNWRWIYLIPVSSRMVRAQALSTEDRQEVALLAFCVTRAWHGQCADHRLPWTAPGWVSQSRGQTDAWCWRHARRSSLVWHLWICSKATRLTMGIKLRDGLYKMRLSPMSALQLTG